MVSAKVERDGPTLDQVQLVLRPWHKELAVMAHGRCCIKGLLDLSLALLLTLIGVGWQCCETTDAPLQSIPGLTTMCTVLAAGTSPSVSHSHNNSLQREASLLPELFETQASGSSSGSESMAYHAGPRASTSGDVSPQPRSGKNPEAAPRDNDTAGNRLEGSTVREHGTVVVDANASGDNAACDAGTKTPIKHTGLTHQDDGDSHSSGDSSYIDSSDEDAYSDVMLAGPALHHVTGSEQ